MQRRLRGRYPWAIALGLLGVIAGGMAGHLIPTPLYRSTGQIRVAPLLDTDASAAMRPHFEAFVATQGDLIVHQQVLRQVMTGESWRQFGRDTSDEDYQNFTGHLIVDPPSSSRLITVHYDDPDPQAAATLVNAVLDAYTANQAGDDGEDAIERLNMLHQRRETLATEVRSLGGRILEEAAKAGSQPLESSHDAKLARIKSLEEELGQVRTSLIAAAAALAMTAAPSQPLSVEAVASVDPRMRQYLAQRELILHELSRLRASLGEQHRAVRKQTSLLASVDQAIQSRRDQGAPPTHDAPPSSAALLRLSGRARELEAKIEDARAQAQAVAQMHMRIAGLRDDEQAAQRDLDDVSEQIDRLRLKIASTGRIDIAVRGELPITPRIDRRGYAAAALGILGGAGGFGAVLLIGLLDPRIRSLNDAIASTESAAVLGTLPIMPEDLTNVAAVTHAADSLHHIRMMMQIGSTRDDHHAFVVTSPGPRTGKTSLSLALGLSFAGGTGTRTLLIDWDLIDSGLSEQAHVILDGRAARAVAEGMGLHAAIGGTPLAKCVRPTLIPNLDLLAVGNRDDRDVNGLSTDAIKRLLDEARRKYDTVIIDTGPTPGIVETAMVAARADGVVLVVPRGEDRARTREAVEHLRDCGANVIGMVYNLANARTMRDVAATNIDIGPPPGNREHADFFEQLVSSGLFSNADDDAALRV
jgi:Mrp family chromosome partitioning ATPase/uncharacterized protein involved in exopolysaccharide biosynthesis